MCLVLFIYEKDIKNWRLKISKKDDYGHILRPVTCRVRTIIITVIDTTEPPLSVGKRLLLITDDLTWEEVD